MGQGAAPPATRRGGCGGRLWCTCAAPPLVPGPPLMPPSSPPQKRFCGLTLQEPLVEVQEHFHQGWLGWALAAQKQHKEWQEQQRQRQQEQQTSRGSKKGRGKGKPKKAPEPPRVGLGLPVARPAAQTAGSTRACCARAPSKAGHRDAAAGQAGGQHQPDQGQQGGGGPALLQLVVPDARVA
jgi:hypothetical protein